MLFHQRQRGWQHTLLLALFGLYVLAIWDASFFPILIPENWSANLNKVDTLHALHQVNWCPFYFGSLASSAAYPFPEATLQRILWFDIIGSILLTIPLGLGMPYFTRVNFKSTLRMALAVGLFLEGSQLVIKLILGTYYPTLWISTMSSGMRSACCWVTQLIGC